MSFIVAGSDEFQRRFFDIDNKFCCRASDTESLHDITCGCWRWCDNGTCCVGQEVLSTHSKTRNLRVHVTVVHGCGCWGCDVRKNESVCTAVVVGVSLSNVDGTSVVIDVHEVASSEVLAGCG